MKQYKAIHILRDIKYSLIVIILIIIVKKLSTTILLILCLSTITYTNSVAQEAGKIKIGAGVKYDAELSTAGLHTNATFRIIERLRVSPNINIYFPSDDDAKGAVQNLWSINLNGHLIVKEGKFYQIYGLGGLNASFVDFEGDVDSGTDYAVNAGAGAEYQLSNFALFGEIKYMIKSNRSVVFGLGARLPLN